jgi:hypothetical protein
MPNVLWRSNVVDSNFRPNSLARRQDIFSSVRDGRRAISVALAIAPYMAPQFAG